MKTERATKNLSLLLCFLMILSLFPVSVFAVDSSPKSDEFVFMSGYNPDSGKAHVITAEFQDKVYVMGKQQPDGTRAAVEAVKISDDDYHKRIIIKKGENSEYETFKVIRAGYFNYKARYKLLTDKGYIVDADTDYDLNTHKLGTEANDSEKNNYRWEVFPWRTCDLGYSLCLVTSGKNPYFALCKGTADGVTTYNTSVYFEGCQHPNMQKIPATEPTCEKDGNRAFYHCPDEEYDNNFSDPDGLNLAEYENINLMAVWAKDDNKDGICDLCNKPMPVFKKVTKPEEIIAGGRYVFVSELDGAKYAMSAGTVNPNTGDFPAVKATSQADGSIKFSDIADSMMFELQQAYMATEWGDGMRYGITTRFKGARMALEFIDSSRALFCEPDPRGAKYGIYINLQADGSVIVSSAYDKSDNICGYVKDGNGCFNFENTVEFSPNSHANDPLYKPAPVYLYRMTDVGKAGDYIYTATNEKPETDYTKYSTDSTQTAATAGVNVTGFLPALNPGTVDNAVLNYTEINTVPANTNVFVQASVNVAVTEYKAGISMTFDLSPVLKVKAGDAALKYYPVADSSLNGNPMTVYLYVPGLNPEVIEHEKEDGTKEYFYNEWSDAVRQYGQKAFYTDFDKSGNNFVYFTVKEYSKIKVIETISIPEVPADRYGYSKLTDENMKNAYAVILKGITDKKDYIDISPFNIPASELSHLLDVIRYDNPQIYFLAGKYFFYTDSSNKVTAVKLGYLETKFDTVAFDTAVNEMISKLSGTEYDKALALHDALVKKVTYDLSAPNAHNAYGAIVEGRAVCEGYAKAYQYLLQKCGIQSYIVTGFAGESHAWNLVKLDGKFYHVDVTWDDPTVSAEREPNKPIYHAYFAISDEIISKDHEITTEEIVLDKCNECKLHPDLVKLDKFTVDGVASAIKAKGKEGIGRIFYTGSEKFGAWFKENIFAAIEKSGVEIEPGKSVTFESCGNEIRISYPAVVHQHAGVKVSGKAPTCTVEGFKDYYKCECGKFFEDEACTREIKDLAAWKIGAGKLEKTAHTPGEIKCDDTHHWRECNVCHTVIDKEAHTYGEWVVVKEPTEETTGLKKRTCTVCGHEQTEVIPVLEHKHDFTGEWKSDETSHWHECRCGEKSDIAEHVYDNDEDDTCNICGHKRELRKSGDINGDNRITAADAVMLKKSILGFVNLDNAQKSAGDINGDGKITAIDALLLKRKVLGL